MLSASWDGRNFIRFGFFVIGLQLEGATDRTQAKENHDFLLRQGSWEKRVPNVFQTCNTLVGLGGSSVVAPKQTRCLANSLSDTTNGWRPNHAKANTKTSITSGKFCRNEKDDTRWRNHWNILKYTAMKWNTCRFFCQDACFMLTGIWRMLWS